MACPSTITFDVYGTLTRWDEAVADAFAEVLAGHGRADADVGFACGAFEAASRRLQAEDAFRRTNTGPPSFNDGPVLL